MGFFTHPIKIPFIFHHQIWINIPVTFSIHYSGNSGCLMWDNQYRIPLKILEIHPLLREINLLMIVPDKKGRYYYISQG